MLSPFQIQTIRRSRFMQNTLQTTAHLACCSVTAAFLHSRDITCKTRHDKFRGVNGRTGKVISHGFFKAIGKNLKAAGKKRKAG